MTCPNVGACSVTMSCASENAAIGYPSTIAGAKARTAASVVQHPASTTARSDDRCDEIFRHLGRQLGLVVFERPPAEPDRLLVSGEVLPAVAAETQVALDV
jgi:hypothetical protein